MQVVLDQLNSAGGIPDHDASSGRGRRTLGRERKRGLSAAETPASQLLTPAAAFGRGPGKKGCSGGSFTSPRSVTLAAPLGTCLAGGQAQLLRETVGVLRAELQHELVAPALG